MSTETKVTTENNVPIVFYCKVCRKITEATKIGTTYTYQCNFCKDKNVAFGTMKSIENFYHIKKDS